MQPSRTVRSEAELEAVATDSLVSAAYGLRYIYEKAAPNKWVEPGSEDAITTAALWEVLTGSYEGLVLEEEREVWVLIDSVVAEPVRPPRPKSSPDYATRVSSRTPVIVTHQTLEEAQAAIEAAAGDGVIEGHTNIWKRSPDTYEFRSSVYIKPGTAAKDFPWKSEETATL